MILDLLSKWWGPPLSLSNFKRGYRKVYQSIYAHTERSGREVIELNVQADHVHLLVKVPVKIAISELVGKVNGKTAIQAFHKFPNLRTKQYRRNHFWAAGYCVDTVGMDAEMIRKYVKFQD